MPNSHPGALDFYFLIQLANFCYFLGAFHPFVCNTSMIDLGLNITILFYVFVCLICSGFSPFFPALFLIDNVVGFVFNHFISPLLAPAFKELRGKTSKFIIIFGSFYHTFFRN